LAIAFAHLKTLNRNSERIPRSLLQGNLQLRCPVSSGMFALFPAVILGICWQQKGINNGILEDTSIRGVQTEPPLFVYTTFYEP